MKTLFICTAITLLLSIFSENSFSQDSLTNSSYQVILDGGQYDGNTVDNFINTIYLNCPDYVNETLKGIHLEQLSRFQIVRVTDPELISVFGNMQSLGVKNKCNPNLSCDTSIDPLFFNPMKYFFDFYSDQITFIYSGFQDIYFRIKPIK